MEEEVSSFLGTNNTERYTKKRCCITLIQAKKDRLLNINQNQSQCHKRWKSMKRYGGLN